MRRQLFGGYSIRKTDAILGVLQSENRALKQRLAEMERMLRQSDAEVRLRLAAPVEQTMMAESAAEAPASEPEAVSETVREPEPLAAVSTPEPEAGAAEPGKLPDPSGSCGDMPGGPDNAPPAAVSSNDAVSAARGEWSVIDSIDSIGEELDRLRAWVLEITGLLAAGQRRIDSEVLDAFRKSGMSAEDALAYFNRSGRG